MLKDIKGYEGHYQISDQGEVYSLKTKKFLKPWIDSKGRYLIIGLSKNNQVTKFLVHRLVGEAFIPNPNNLPEIDHIDRNTQNNRVENLQWITHLENMNKLYQESTPLRHYRSCALYYEDKLIGVFVSISAAATYAAARGASKSGIQKYHKSAGWKVETCIDYDIDVSTVLDEQGREVVPEFGVKLS